MKTSTYFSLMAEFGTAQIPLGDMCHKYFSLSLPEAKRKAAKQGLPVPILKIRSHYFVKSELLAEYIDKQAEEAVKEWESVNC